MKLRKEYQIITIITFLIALIVITETNFPEQLNFSAYHFVKEEYLINSPEKYEGTKISSATTIKEVTSLNASYDIATSENNLLLLINKSFNLDEYDDIAFRGTAYLTSKGLVEVTEIHKFNASVYYYSAPGIILFVALVFYFFTFDFKELSFKPRKTRKAGKTSKPRRKKDA